MSRGRTRFTLPPVPRGVWSTLAALTAWSACALVPPPPRARVRRGPAFAQPPARVLALPATCQAVEEGVCRLEYPPAVESAARMALEFAGATLIDSELVNTHVRRRREHVQESTGGVWWSRSSQVEVSGITWNEASPDEQRDLARELRIGGFLRSDILIGGARGWSQQRTVEVRLEITRAADGAQVWTSRCSVETGDHHATEQALELATRCALDSATLL